MSGPSEKDEKPARGLYGQRPSKSADAARRADIERQRALGPRGRALLALRLGRRVKQLQRAVRANEEDGRYDGSDD